VLPLSKNDKIRKNLDLIADEIEAPHSSLGGAFGEGVGSVNDAIGRSYDRKFWLSGKNGCYIVRMDDTIRQRMKSALEKRASMLGEKPETYHYKVSVKVSTNRNYLWEAFSKQKGGLHVLKKICDLEGINFFWLIDGAGDPFGKVECRDKIDREAFLATLEAILSHYSLLEETEIKHAALAVLDVVEHPPDGELDVDMRDKIRISVLSQLRVYGRRLGQ
jgi:hypothetical protein